MVVSNFEASVGVSAAADALLPTGADAPASDTVAVPGQFPGPVFDDCAAAPPRHLVEQLSKSQSVRRAPGEAPPLSTSLAMPSFRLWHVATGRWTPVGDQSPATMSAEQSVDLSAALRATRIQVRRVHRSAERRAARVSVRRAAYSAERCAARLAVRRVAQNLASGVRGCETSGAASYTGAASAAGAAAAGGGNNCRAAAACHGISGRPSDWPTSSCSRPGNRQRTRVRAARTEIRGVRDGSGATLSRRVRSCARRVRGS